MPENETYGVRMLFLITHQIRVLRLEVPVHIRAATILRQFQRHRAGLITFR